MESVPRDAAGTFSLLYMPFDLMGSPHKKMKDEAIGDMELTLAAIKDLMLKYGFSAKRSSGYGIARERLTNEDGSGSGLVAMKADEVISKQFEDFDGMREEAATLLKNG